MVDNDEIVAGSTHLPKGDRQIDGMHGMRAP
jgi:hypothetical protein